jgi:hypothetical protein
LFYIILYNKTEIIAIAVLFYLPFAANWQNTQWMRER